MNGQRPETCIIVIFGASGDLTKRKLGPALQNLAKRELMPDNFAILGVGRTDLSDEDFRLRLAAEYADYDRDFLEALHYQRLDTESTDDYALLSNRLLEIDESLGARGNYLFYLSTPPSMFGPIAQGLSQHNLNEEIPGHGWRRLVVEKPFGYDLDSARRLAIQLHDVFEERQIFRIDHYLGKETVQNMLVLRFGNGIFEPLWNRNYIDRVEVTAAESLGVEGRGGYYEQSGALRDMFQNHLLQVVGMITMEPPAVFNAPSVRNETMKVFESLRPLDEDTVRRDVVRGQYLASTIRGERVPGYREESGVDDESKTETYIAVRFFIDNWRWADVPFIVRTGKRLPTRVTEAVIHFKRAPHKLFGSFSTDDECYGCNQLIIRIQPDEGILVKFNMKLPGGGFETKSVNMDFHYSELSDVYTPEAYERLLLDSLMGDATLYARNDAVEACWRFVQPIIDSWASDSDTPLHGYPAGTWGPPAARELLHSSELDWRYPCRNLSNDGEYCEL